MASAKAIVKLQRISVRKANLVAALIRNKPISEALSTLKFTEKKASTILLKLLNSAIANGVNNHGLNADKLFVSDVQVTEGPTLKRFQPHGRGSASSIFKRTSNFMIEVSER